MKQTSDVPVVLREKVTGLEEAKTDLVRQPIYLRAIFSLSALKSFIGQKILKRSRYDFLVALSVLIYGIVFSWFMIRKNYGFGTFAGDLGTFNQSFHTTIFNGKLFYSTVELYLNPSGTFFASKFSPILFLVLPFYAIVPSVNTLLVLKSFTLALAAVPLYLLTKDMIGSEKAGFVMALAYLLNPALQSANGFDFQPQMFIPITIFFSFYFMIKKQWKPYLLFVLLALMVEEHVAVILFLMSFFQFLTISRARTFVQEIRKLHFSRPSRISLILIVTMVFSASWYFISRLIRQAYSVPPEFTDVYRAVRSYSVLGFTGDILSLPAYILMNPQRTYEALTYDFHLKFLYLIFLFAPLAFLSLRSKLTLAVAVLLAPFLLSNYQPYYMLGDHYPLYVLPLIFLGAVETLGGLAKEGNVASRMNIKNVKPALRGIIAVTLVFAIAVSPLSPLNQPFENKGLLMYSEPLSNEHYIETLHEMINIVPQDASILTQNNIFPHFSDRINAYAVPAAVPTEPETLANATENYIRHELDLCDYVLVDSVGIATESWTSFLFEEVMNSSEFKIYALGGSAVLFKKHYNGSTLLVPGGDYENFLGYSDFLLSNAQVVNDPTSNSGQVAYIQGGVAPNISLSGPYVLLPQGTLSITFEIKVGAHEEGYLGTLDVSGNYGAFILSKEDIYGFNTPTNLWTNFTLSLTTTQPTRAVEFRVFTSGATDIYVDRVIVRTANEIAEADFGTYTFSRKDLPLETGELTNDGFIVNTRSLPQTYIWFGPYATLPLGKYKATFFIKASSPITGPNQKVLTLDAAALSGTSELGGMDVYSSDLLDSKSMSGWHNFTLMFTLDHTLADVEFRGFNTSPDVNISLGFILVERFT